MSINPDYGPLKIAQIKLLRFANLHGTASDVCDYIMKSGRFSKEYRQLAFCEMVEIVSETKEFQMALSMIEKTVNKLSFEPAIKRIAFIKSRIYAENYMIGMNNKKGERVIIKEVADFFLQKESGVYPYPVLSARVLEWIGRKTEAEELLREVISKDFPNSWEAHRELVYQLDRAGRFPEAIAQAQKLVELWPWRAGSFDALSLIAEHAGDAEKAEIAGKMGDEIFNKELKLFDELQAYISQSD